MRPIGLDGFEDVFARDPDPWRTFSDRDEAVKRSAILHALGSRKRGRVLELGAGNGSNSVALARRALQLDATEGSHAGVRLVGKALDGRPRARALRLALPHRFPRPAYDGIVVAELLYYLSPRAMAETAWEVARTLTVGGRLVLAHHHIQFHDFVQPAAGIHRRFLAATGAAWRPVAHRDTARWTVRGLVRGPG